MVPLFVSDLKLAVQDFNKAFIETAAYAVRIMEDSKWRSTHHTILIGLPMTLDQISLCVYIEIPEKVMCIDVIMVDRVNLQDLRKLFGVLHIVVHYMIENPIKKKTKTTTHM